MNHIVGHKKHVSGFYVESRQEGITVKNEAYDTVDILNHGTYLFTNICLMIVMWFGL